MGWKYIMVKNRVGDTEVLFPVIFPDKMVHEQVYLALRGIMPGWLHGHLDKRSGVKAIAAGSIEHLEVEGLGGRSDTLNLLSRPEEDTRVIENYSYQHGVV